MRRLFTKGDISLTVPFVTAQTDGGVVLVGGVPNEVEEDNSGPGSSSSGSSSLTGQTLGTKNRESGLGDIVLRGRYYLIEEQELTPLVAITGRVKFPTADEGRGLGTGEFDEGFGVELSKTLFTDWIAYLDGGYTFIGDPTGLDLNNQWYYDLGAGYYITNNLLASVFYEEFRALREGNSNPRDFLFSLNLKASSAWRLTTSVLVGVSDGAPDYEFTGGLSYRF